MFDPNVEGLKQKHDVRSLLETLSGHYWFASEGFFGPKASYDAASRTVLASLRRLGRGAVPALIDALQDNSFLVRLEAVKALGKLGDARAAEPILTALSEAKNERRKWQKDPFTPWFHQAGALLKACETALENIGGPAVEAAQLAEQLAAAEAEVGRLAAKLASGRFRDNAPPALVVQEEKKVAAAQTRVEELRQRLAEYRARQK
jgi:phage shock protein A